MIKVAYLISTLQKTGPTNILVGTIDCLDKKQYEPFVITLSPEKELVDSWLPHFKKQGVSVVSLNLKRYQLLQPFAKIRQIISFIQPDIIHCHCFRSTILAALFLKKFKRVATIHSDYTQDFPDTYGKIIGRGMSFLFTQALKKMNLRICCSRVLADLLKQKMPFMSFDYVNNGVDTQIFYPTSDKQKVRKTLGLPSDKIIFVWAGTFSQLKNPLCLVKAIKNIKDKRAFFVFCGGKGPLLKEAKKQLKDFRNVLFTGYTSQIFLYFQAGDFYISTSLSEGFHLTVYEALACGMPAILSDLEVYKEIQQAGCSFMYRRDSTESLQTLIVKLLSYRAVDMVEKGIALIKQDFSIQSMSEKYQQYYQEI